MLPVLTVTAPVVRGVALVPAAPILQTGVVRANGWLGSIRCFQNLSDGDFQRLQDRGGDQKVSCGLHVHAVRGWVKLRRSAYLCAAEDQVENRIEVNEVNALPLCDLTDCLAIGFQLEVLGSPQVLVNDRLESANKSQRMCLP